jgi:uncharacterized repeat protein (TIGR03806 family)
MMRKLGMVAVAAALVTCGDNQPGEKTIPYDTLAEYGFFEGDGHTQAPLPGVVPYDVIAPLYSDETLKHRFVVLPPGATIGYDNEGPWQYPVGTILIKTFAYPIDARDPSLGERLLETRLLIHEPGGWTAHTYQWNEAQTEARRKVAGDHVPVSWIDETGATRELDYRLPNTNQCQNCHGETGNIHPLGPRTRQLNHDFDYGAGVGAKNQIDRWQELGMFAAAPPAAAERPALTAYTDPQQPIEARARAYLEANCAHCHNEGAPAESSGLRLAIEETDAVDLGVCRKPFSSGNVPDQYQFDVVPGHPELSLLVYRMASTDPEIKMPELPTVTSDARGVAIVTDWIAAMPENLCP